MMSGRPNPWTFSWVSDRPRPRRVYGDLSPVGVGRFVSRPVLFLRCENVTRTIWQWRAGPTDNVRTYGAKPSCNLQKEIVHRSRGSGRRRCVRSDHERGPGQEVHVSTTRGRMGAVEVSLCWIKMRSSPISRLWVRDGIPSSVTSSLCKFITGTSHRPRLLLTSAHCPSSPLPVSPPPSSTEVQRRGRTTHSRTTIYPTSQSYLGSYVMYT